MFDGWKTFAIVMVAAIVAACDGTPGAGLGDSCARHDDCAASAQCFHQVCTPRCATHDECGNGYVCEADGTCARVSSQIGDPCAREIDCGPRQSCQLDNADHDGDGWLAATCQPELTAGNVAGTACGADGDCVTGICSLGRCSEVCSTGDDCAPDLACVDMPRLLPGDAPLFRGCLQAAGRLEVAVAPLETGDPIRVPVPGNAVSFAVTSQVDDDRLVVGARYVEAPDGRVLYSGTTGADDPIRYRPTRRISTLLIPNAPQVPVDVGAYSMVIAATHDNGVSANELPEIRVVYKLGGDELAASLLDLDLYFLDLKDHPCAAGFDDGAPNATLDAALAESSPGFQLYLLALQSALGDSGLTLGDVRYRDVSGHPEYDALGRDELGALLSEASDGTGVDVFFVRSIDPIGVQALSGGTPGPAGIPGTPASGIAVSLETLCYRGWGGLAHATAHALGSQLGLFRNLEPDGATTDPIPDSPDDASNLMHFSEFAGDALSPGQRDVLRRSPATRNGDAAAASTPASIPADSTAVEPTDALRDLLGGIDFVPAPLHLDPLLGDDPAADLIALATTDEIDRGVRLRAFRALAEYPGHPTAAALIPEIARRRGAASGSELLTLHAAMGALGAIGGDGAVEPLRPLLDHDSKDTRAAAAAALGASGSKLAEDPLYDRLTVEPDEMVRLALTDAIRRLNDGAQ